MGKKLWAALAATAAFSRAPCFADAARLGEDASAMGHSRLHKRRQPHASPGSVLENDEGMSEFEKMDMDFDMASGPQSLGVQVTSKAKQSGEAKKAEQELESMDKRQFDDMITLMKSMNVLREPGEETATKSKSQTSSRSSSASKAQLSLPTHPGSQAEPTQVSLLRRACKRR